MIKCLICQNEFKNLIGLYSHVHKAHNDIITIKEYYDKFIKTENEGKCKLCGKPTRFIKPSKGYRTYCSTKCSTNDPEIKNKSKETYFKKTGYIHNSQNPLNELKRKETCISKYGVDSYFKLPEVIEKNKEKLKENSQPINKKRKETCISKYGVDNVSKDNSIKNKIKNVFISKYGVNHPMQINEIKLKRVNNTDYNDLVRIEKIRKSKLKNAIILYEEKSLKFNLEVLNIGGGKIKCKCDKGHTFEIQTQLFRLRYNKSITPCTICQPLNECTINKSKYELEIYNFLKNYINDDIMLNDRSVLKDKELDIYIPNKNLAIEFNGLYWHSELHKDRNYHYNKTDNVNKHNIHLIHIFEDDWIYKQDIIKSRLKGILGINKRIFARKCKISEVNYKDAAKFLNSNHIQGSCVSSLRYGLYYEGTLVALMTFGKSRFEKNKIELHRYCSVLEYNIIGGASKLFKHFLKNNNYKEIVSYADRCWSKGDLYYKLGFKLDSITQPNYYYVIDKIRVNRMKFQKSKLLKCGYDKNKSENEIMKDLGYYRIYDAGNLKFCYK